VEKPKLYASCKGDNCGHQFMSVGEPNGAPPAGKPKGDPVVLLTCPQCGTTREIPVKDFKVPAVSAPAKPAETPPTDDPKQPGAGGNQPADQT
jgi:hypothetical protein